MKKLKAALGIMLALVMLLSAVQVSTVSVSAKTPEDNPSSGYDMTIDFNYKDKYSSPEQAMAGYTDEQFEPMSAMYSNYKTKQYRWVQIEDNVLSYKKNGDALRKALENDGDGTGYVLLKNDQKLTLTKQVWQPIEITRDTVLDLNGYALELHDNYNVKGTKQRADESSQSSYMFDISNRATLTIIDSSAIRGEGDDDKGTGSVFIDGRMIDPYKNKYDWYTHRDIFHVNDGNLVIYGGSYQAGRSKVEKKKNFSWDKLKTAIGSAVTLGLAIYEYSTGIGEAEAALKDVQAGFDTALKAVEEGKADDDNPKSSAGGAKDLTTENQKKGNDDEVAKEQKVNIPTKDVKAPASKTDEKDSKGRNETVDEKSKRRDDENEKDGKAKEGENKANSDQASKNDKNTKIYQAEKAVGNAALNPDKIGEMVNSAFDLTDAVVGMFGSKGAIVETVWGTCVKVGSQGTFVSYGGNYIGYGSSPYERNAVVEVARPKNSTKGGKAYIYDGTFEGKAGANTFNIVRTRSFNWKDTPNGKTSGNKDIDFLSTSYFKDENGKTREYVYETGICNDDGLADSENYMKTLEEDENGNPYDTSCIQVRGGTFRNYYEHLNVGARLRTYGTDENFEAYAGTSGTVHLGIGSFNENFIRDGRIQIIDTYGDGALVLMDAKDKADENVYHYRLYCGDTELRCKRYLRVYPTEAESNSSHSFKLTTQYRNQNTHSTGSAAQGLITTDKNGNVVTEVMENEDKLDDVEDSGAFSQREMFFYYPIGISNSHNYYVVPDLNDGTDVKGERLGASSAWYYNTPTDYYGHPIDSFVFRDEVIYSTISDTISGSKRENEKSFEEYKQKIADGVFTGPSHTYGMHSYNYLSNFKWFKYRVYRVDPLTRENISESDTYGVDKPLKEAIYGASTDSLRCKLPLDELGINYKPGEIYRIVFDVDEYVGYDYNDTLRKHTSNLDTAKLECSMLFMCYDGKEEITDKGNNYFDEDYTPLQWDKAPEGGKTASVRLVNGKTGQVDCNGDNIFDVYYQWYQVEDDGTEKMIAGTDNIFTGDIINGKANPDKWATKDHHLIQHFKAKGTYYNSAYINDSESDGYTYVNSIKPGTDTTGFLDTGLPRDRAKWTEQMLHMYTQEDRTKSDYTKDGSSKLYLANNKPFQYNTDSCYIPESAKGKRIYCKVICVNTFWQKNYAHVQVFRTHTERVSKDIEAKVALSIDGDSNYIGKDGKGTFSLSGLRGLQNGEYISEIGYHYNTKTDVDKDYKNIEVYNDDELKNYTAVFPDQFTGKKSLDDIKNTADGPQTMSVVVRTNKGRSKEFVLPFVYGLDHQIGDIGWSYNESTKVITFYGDGTGKMPDFESGEKPPWHHLFAQEPVEKIVIKKGVTYIGDYAFEGRKELKYIEFEKGSKLSEIGDSAFEGTNIQGDLILPDKVTKIGASAFASNKNLQYFKAYYLKEIPDNAFSGCSSLETLNCYSLTEIGFNAFYDCEKLKDVSNTSKVEGFGGECFRGCKSLTEISFAAAKDIGYRAFKGVPLKIVAGNNFEFIGENAFDPDSGILMMTSNKNNALLTYANKNGLSGKEYDDGELYWYFDAQNSELYISGESTGNYKSMDEVPWNNSLGAAEYIKTVVIDDGVSEIGDWALSMIGAEKITIPDTVKRIGEKAFVFSALKELNLGQVEEIDKNAFAFCVNLNNELIIPKSCEKIGETAFGFAPLNNITVLNPACRFGALVFTKTTEEQKLSGYEASTLQRYAEDNGFEFAKINPYPELSVTNAVARENSEVKVDVMISNNPGITTLGVTLEYGDDITLVNAEFNKLFSSKAMGNEIEKGKYRIQWNSTSSEDETANGVIATLTFKVAKNALAYNPIKISYDPDDIINQELNPVNFILTNGFIKVKDLKPGDVNNDDKVNMKDVTILQKYLNFYDISVNPVSSDVDADGRITMKDVVLIQKYLNGLEVILK